MRHIRRPALSDTVSGSGGTSTLPVYLTTTGNAKDKIPLVCPNVYYSIIANSEFEQASEGTGESFSTAAMDLQRPLYARKDA